MARHAIAGEFGNGDARRAPPGARYDEVRAEVNQVLSGGDASGGGVSGVGCDLDGFARRAINGDYGSGEARRERVGAVYEAVQRRVNELLRKR